MPGGKGGAQRIDPFDSQGQEQLINPLLGLLGSAGVGGDIDIGKIQNAIRGTNPLEQRAANTLQGPQGAQSFLQGGQGALGTSGGLFGQAQQAVGADPLGAQGAFRNFLSQGFTDVQNDPNVQRLLATQAGQAQNFLNQNLGEIGASSQRASGGVGSGSGETAAKTRAVTQATGALAGQQAQTLFGEQARRQGVQLAAAQQGLGFGNQQAALLGQLGSGLGQIGLGAGGLGSQLLGQQIGLGGTFQGRGAGAELFPLEQMFRLGELLKSSAGVRQPGFLEQLGSLGTAAGGAALGLGAAGIGGLAKT